MVRDRRGFALVVTLLVTALLVALVVEFITDVYVETSSRQRFVAGQQASLLADSGINGARSLLQFNLNLQSDFTSLKDRWAQPQEIQDELGRLRVVIEEENGKLNLANLAGPAGEFNQIYLEPSLRLFRRLKLPAEDLCDALADWIDTNDTPKPGGGEAPWYLARQPRCTIRNGPLLTLEELALVKGFDRGVLETVRPFVTIYADQGDLAYVNINTAPREVLLALDDQMTETLADRIIEHRRATPFKSRGELSQVAGMETIVSRIRVPLRTRGSIYRLWAEATVNGTTRVIETVISVTGSSSTTLYWREF
jgi:general secretion pathway protein K